MTSSNPKYPPLIGSEPIGSFSFESLSSHERLDMAIAMQSPSKGLLLYNDPSNDDHLEPFLYWHLPFRDGSIIIMRGQFSGKWGLDFNGFNALESVQFSRHVVNLLEEMLGFHDQEIMKNLWICDSSGCPLGYVNYN